MVACAVLYASFLSILAIRAHLGLQTQMNDLGNANQVFWAATQGDWQMHQSNNLDERIRPRFAVHANVLFLPLTLLYHLWADPRILLVLASIACATTGLGLFFLSRRLLGESWWTLVPPAVFFLSPIVHDANLYDFHIITLAAAILVWSIWAFATNRIRWGWVLFGLLLLCKEDMPFVGLMLGTHFLITGERRRGLTMIAVSAAYLVVILGAILPIITGGELAARGTSNRYDWLLERPWDILETVTRPDRIRLPIYFLLSGAIAAWRARSWLLLTIPHLAMGLFSATTWMTRLTGAYYWIVIEAVIILACIHAARPTKRHRGPNRWPLIYLAAATAVFTLLFSPLPYGLGSSWENYSVDADRQTLSEVVTQAGLDSPDVALTVQNNLGPQLSQRWDISSFPRRLASVDAIVLHLRYKGGPASGLFVRGSPRFMFGMQPRHLITLSERLARSRDWGLTIRRDGFYVFERGAENVLPESKVLDAIGRDAEILAEQYGRALRFRSPLARYVVDGLSWGDLFGGGSVPAKGVSENSLSLGQSLGLFVMWP